MQSKHLKTVVNEYNRRTGSNLVIKHNTQAFDENDIEISKPDMINPIVSQNKSVPSQALRTPKSIQPINYLF